MGLTKELHEIYGHVGARKIYRMMEEEFYLKNLRRYVEKRIATCDTCQRNKYPTQACQAKMQTILPEKPGDLLSIDFYGPLPTSRGGAKHILVTLENFTKVNSWHFTPYEEQTLSSGDTVARKIFLHYIPHFGRPTRIQCDHGTQFTSPKWAEKLKNENIKLIFSLIRHPQGNKVERVNRELG